MNRKRSFAAWLAIACAVLAGGCQESGPYVNVDSGNFEEVVLNSDKPVMVDFWADWCGPCHAVAPAISQVAVEFEGRAVVAKLDTDQAQDIAQAYGINAIPTVIFFQNGEEVMRFHPQADRIDQMRNQLDKMIQ